MKNSMLKIFIKYKSFCYKYLNLKYERYSFSILYSLLFLSFFYSSCMIFLNYDNIFFRKVFYFYSENELISDLRYLKKRQTLKENLDFLVKDFLLGNSKGFSFLLDTRNVKFLYSFMSNGIYFINISKDFYDSFDDFSYHNYGKLRLNLFIKSLKETINFNYPGYVKDLVIFIEGYVLSNKNDNFQALGIL
ncbi:flagellar filament outsheath protein [Borrelia sp. A-FGy1]|uniref:flagellar filament outsheath protein n=1 Tax=Borrelia sp. A-FGy1 TaxID=2608247 RepID=UPI0015F6B990|nr:flagellar filament outsheath protein [Borrelia sp. A-FGy1]QMU99419.1 flagellar filament outsheath protein [Borrelia sp. A-FGy1]